MVKVSIIICTRNHAPVLAETMRSLQDVRVPPDVEPELIVVDNASQDETSEVACRCMPGNMAGRLLNEPRRGQVRARNAGLVASVGDIILFTDDDVRLPNDWLSGMCAPIRAGRAHGVAGGVRLAPHLKRPWMQTKHRSALACTEFLDPCNPAQMVGANMAFSREVLSKVPCFDPELGPGQLGFNDDTLFSAQIKDAGYILETALDVEVEHHPDESRLLRAAYLERSVKQGRSSAYLRHHWHHQEVPNIRRMQLRYMIHLAYLRVKRREEYHRVEGCALWEMSTVETLSFYQQYLIEHQRPRNYERRGLQKKLV